MIGIRRHNRAGVDSGPLLIDLNLLPVEYRRRALSRRDLLLLLLAVLALAPVYPAFQSRQNVAAESAVLQSSLKRMQAQVQELRADEAQATELQGSVDEVERQLQAMNRDYQALLGGQVALAPILQTIYDSLPSTVTIDQVVQTQTKLTLQGKGSSYDAIVGYAKRLSESGTFASSSLQMRRPIEQGGESQAPGVAYTLVVEAKKGMDAES